MSFFWIFVNLKRGFCAVFAYINNEFIFMKVGSYAK